MNANDAKQKVVRSSRRQRSIGDGGGLTCSRIVSALMLLLVYATAAYAQAESRPAQATSTTKEAEDQATTNTTVLFADANLEAAVRRTLRIPPAKPITKQDMLRLTSLRCVRGAISNLSGLEYAANIEQLDLFQNKISDLSTLSALTHLKHIYLGRNQLVFKVLLRSKR